MSKISCVLLAAYSLSIPTYAAVIVIPDGTIETSVVLVPDPGDTLIIEKDAAIVVDSQDGVTMQAENQTVLNQGTITTQGFARGICTINNNNSVITNSGRIITIGDDGVGIFNSSSGNTMITNSGLVSTKANATHGIFNEGGDNVMITNSGLISTEGVGAHSVFNMDGGSAVVTNSGLLMTVGEGAHGVSNDESNFAAILNNGRISTAGDSSQGIVNNGGTSSSDFVTVTNTGLISTTGADAIGILTGGDQGSSNGVVITNSGRIVTTGVGSQAIVNSGSNGSSNDVVIINSGLISTAGLDTAAISNLTDAGIANNAHIINSGTIISAQSFALTVEGSNPTVSLLRGSNLQGAVRILDDPLTLNVETGLNLALTIQGSFGNLGIEAPFVLLNDTIAVIDPTGFALQADVLADLSDTILDGIYRHRAGFPCQCIPCGCEMWVQGIGSYRERSRDKDFVGYDNWQGGFLAGLDINLCRSNLGLFGGASYGEAEVDEQTQKADITSFMGGLTYERYFCNTFLGAALAVGSMDWENERFIMNNLVVGGVERAKANTGGIFVSPEATLAHRFASLWCHPTMSFTVRYAGLFLRDSNEKGSSTNLSVEGRQIELLTTKFELALPYTAIREACCWSVEPYVGVFGRYQLGGKCVDARLLGQTLHFDSGIPRNLVALVFGFRGVQSYRCANLFLNLEGSFDNYSSSRILGEGGIGFNF